MRTTKLAGTAAMMAALALGACTDTSGPEALDDDLLLNAALVAADATIEDVTLMGVPMGFGLMGVEGQGNGFNGPGQMGGHNGIGGRLSGTRSATFYDINGVEQEAYDALSTARIEVEMELEGEVERQSWSASIHRERSMTLTGLEGEEVTRTMNGTGSEEVARSRDLDDGSQQTHDMDGEFEYSNVVVPIPGSESRWPLSGTVSRTMHVKVVNGPDGDVEKTVEIVITFDGDETASAVINGEVTEIDLSTRKGRWPFKGGKFGRGNGNGQSGG